jgi:hypothetical protein
MARFVLSMIVALLAASTAVTAQTPVERQTHATPGRDARVGVFADIKSDCTSGPLPVIRLVTPPAHGAINVKRGTLKLTNYKQCLATEVPAFVVLYRATDGFSGGDNFMLEVTFAGGRRELQHFTVNVSASPGSGQGI